MTPSLRLTIHAGRTMQITKFSLHLADNVEAQACLADTEHGLVARPKVAHPRRTPRAPAFARRRPEVAQMPPFATQSS